MLHASALIFMLHVHAERGKQAADAGLPAGASRNAVVGLAWLEFVLFLAAALVVIYDRWVLAAPLHRWRQVLGKWLPLASGMHQYIAGGRTAFLCGVRSWQLGLWLRPCLLPRP